MNTFWLMKIRPFKVLSLGLVILCVLMAREVRGQQAPPPAKPPHEAPAIEDVHRAALNHYKLGTTHRLTRTKRRIRRANMLPDIELRSTWRAQHEQENDYREDIDFDDLGITIQDSARHDAKFGEIKQNTYSVTVRFKLSGLVFDPEELDVDRQQLQHTQRRERLLTQVNALYYERTHHIARTRELDLDQEELLTHHTIIQRCEADLDALTGGWFSQQLEGHHEP